MDYNNNMTNEEFVAASFKFFVTNILNQIINSYKGNHYSLELQENVLYDGDSYWLKTSEINFNYDFDLFKSESILNPYIGYLEMKNEVAIYGDFETEQWKYKSKQEAALASDVVDFWNGKHFKFTYGYQNGQWVKIKVEYIHPVLNPDEWKEENKTFSEYEFFCSDKIRD